MRPPSPDSTGPPPRQQRVGGSTSTVDPVGHPWPPLSPIGGGASSQSLPTVREPVGISVPGRRLSPQRPLDQVHYLTSRPPPHCCLPLGLRSLRCVSLSLNLTCCCLTSSPLPCIDARTRWRTRVQLLSVPCPNLRHI
jgi:hypothetical protein